MAKKQEYGNESIKSLKGADRVRKRPAVIFGSDGVEGCAHSIFEIVSNSIDEARDGHGNKINVTLFADHSVEVEDFGRGIPVDYNKAEQRWNWDLVFCELYAGGKYAEGSGTYDFSLGLNGLGLCATHAPVRSSAGSRTPTCSPTSPCRPKPSGICSSGRQWSTPVSRWALTTVPAAKAKRANTITKTASPITSPSWRGTTP